MIYWWQRIIAILAALTGILFAIYFIAPQIFIVQDSPLLAWMFEIVILVGIYILVIKLFKHINKVKYAQDWAKHNNQLTVTNSGEVYKESEKALVFNTVSELINKDDIAALHYTNLFLHGHLITEGSRYYIIEKDDSGEIARLETLFYGDVPVVADEKPHSYQGTLMVENSRVYLQWAKLDQ